MRWRSRWSGWSGSVVALLPGLSVLRGYQRAWFRADVVAGLTVGAMLIPQSMGYAALAGMPPEYGFYAVVGALVVYALFGSSRHLGVGPEPGTAILAATGVATIAGGDPRRYIALMAGLAIVVGAVCVLAAALRLGYLAGMLAKPVLVGYITGVGLTLLSSQFAAFTGASVTADSFFSRCWQLATSLDEVQGATIGVGAATLVLMLTLRWAVPNAPVALVGVALATAVTAVFSFSSIRASLS